MKQCFLIPIINFEIDWLKHILPEDALVLPIYIDALEQCRNHFEHVLSIEDLVPYPRIMELAEQATQMTLSFAQFACQGEMIAGYDIPRICWQGLEYFFRDTLLAQELAFALRDAGFERITWVGTKARKPAYYSATNDAVIETLSLNLGNAFQVLSPISGLPGLKHIDLDRLQSGFNFLRERASGLMFQPYKCRIAAIFTPREWSRYTDAFDEMARAYTGDFQIWSMGAVPAEMREWGKQHHVHIANIAYPHNVADDVRAFFRRHWQLWLKERRQAFARVQNCQFLASDDLQYHFEFSFLRIWPRIAQWACRLEREMYEAKLEWVLASSDYVPAYALPHYVSAKLGIPSVALPHTYAPWSGVTTKASFLACRNRFEQISLSRVFPDQSRVWLCRNAANALSYTPKQVRAHPFSHKRLVAILVADEDLRGTLMAKINRAVFLDTLDALCAPTAEFADLDFVFKSHPRFDLSGLILDLHSRHHSPNVSVLDSATSVTDLVANAWIVVLCNYFGSASVQAIESGKPVIFLNSAQNFWPGAECRALSAGRVVPDMPSFWSVLRELRDSPEQYQQLASQARKFREEYLQPVQQTLATILQTLGRPASRTTPSSTRRSDDHEP